ncbi:MAG TPA: hypothetical protein VF765_06045 [Polyangiaceae bacterium]
MSRSRAAALVALLSFTSACERGCAKGWFEKHGVGEQGFAPQGAAPMNALDCPDGLARCTGGVVEASRLASIPQPCKGAPESCVCPWERLGACEERCVADGLEMVVDRAVALPQLCAPGPDSGTLARIATGTGAPQPAECDEDVAYRCSAGAVVACAEHRVVGACERGCFAEGTEVGADVPINREAAFAILCSR